MTDRARRPGLHLTLGFILAACTPTAPPAKPGSNAEIEARDSAECRAIAQREAQRLNPFGASFSAAGVQGAILSQRRDNRDRFAAELRVFRTCMRDRGCASAQDE